MAAEQHRLICAWCKKDLGATTCPDGDSHGICEPCAAKETLKVDRLDLVAHMRELHALGQLDTPGRLAGAAGVIARQGF